MEIAETAKSRWAFSSGFKPTRSILKTPGAIDLSPRSSRSSSESPLSTPISRVRFGEVKVLEFEQKAGSASHGVPEKGAVSLYMGELIDSQEPIPVEKFEQKRRARLFQRAQKIHTVVDEGELYTRGRQDLLFSSYTYRDRLRKYQNANNGEKIKPEDLKKEEKELAFIRKSREHVGCTCRPISQLSVVELRQVLVKYGLPTHGKRKVLQDRVKADVLQSNSPLLARLREPSESPCYSPESVYRFGKPLAESGKKKPTSRRTKNKRSQKSELDKCCWDDSCECVQSGILCHQNSSCGCLENDKPCDNPNGQYIYKEPHYSKKVLEEWIQEYNDIPSGDSDMEVSQSCSQDNSVSRSSEPLSTFILQ